MAFLNETGLNHFWEKIKTKLSGKADIGHAHSISDISDLQSTITSLSNKITSLENELANKQDKIDNWGDLKGE